MPASKRVPLVWKPALLERDGHRCVYCGETAKDVLTLDHLIPRRHGGPDRMWNLAIACETCNGRKFTNVWPAALDLVVANLRRLADDTRRDIAAIRQAA